jgi:hypothetical protein
MPGTAVPDAVVYRIVELLVSEKRTPSEIREVIRREFPSVHVTRESIYPLLSRAWEQGYLRLVPPIETALAAQLVAKYRLAAGAVRVVDCPRPESNASVSSAAAAWALELMGPLSKEVTGAIGLGLGPGRATRDFSVAFSQLVSTHSPPPKLDLIAISAGCPARFPEFSSISFFNFFKSADVNERIGLFAETLVRSRDFAEIQTRPGVREAFAAKTEGRIHMVVTSMGDMEDPHSLLRRFLDDCPSKPRFMKEAVGDVQYRPFSEKGFVKEGPDDLRAVTLFELEDLVQMAKERARIVLLIARQCGACKEPGRTRARPLRPILENPAMRVFSHLVVDSPTARVLLA